MDASDAGEEEETGLVEDPERSEKGVEQNDTPSRQPSKQPSRQRSEIDTVSGEKWLWRHKFALLCGTAATFFVLGAVSSFLFIRATSRPLVEASRGDANLREASPPKFLNLAVARNSSAATPAEASPPTFVTPAEVINTSIASVEASPPAPSNHAEARNTSVASAEASPPASSRPAEARRNASAATAEVSPPAISNLAEARNTSVASAEVVPASSEAPAAPTAAGGGPEEASMGPATLEQHPDAPVIIHHLRFPRAFRVCNKYLLRDLPRLDSPRIFCFTWVRPPEDNPKKGTEPQLPELREMYAECDGWSIFSNFDDPERGITKAHDGASGKNARSSIQFQSIYDRLVHDPSLTAYDWFLDLEPDHFVRVRSLRRALAKSGQQFSGAVYLTLLNFRAFNKEFLIEAAKQWDKVGGRLETGCPVYTPKLPNNNCQGDVTMPRMGRAMANVSVMGFAGRGGPLGPFFEVQTMGKGWDEEQVQVQKVCSLARAEGDDLCSQEDPRPAPP